MALGAPTDGLLVALLNCFRPYTGFARGWEAELGLEPGICELKFRNSHQI